MRVTLSLAACLALAAPAAAQPAAPPRAPLPPLPVVEPVDPEPTAPFLLLAEPEDPDARRFALSFDFQSPPEAQATQERDEQRERMRVVRVDTPTPRGCRSDAIAKMEDVEELYGCGRKALDRGEWDQALAAFTRAAAAQGTRVPAALYWRAYAQNRLGQRAEALATLAELRSRYASSGWATEAGALEVHVRQLTGQPVAPDAAPDDELKLLALQGLARADVATAVPMIESLLSGAHPPRLKERALFVLAHSDKPEAREVVVRVAKGGANPDLQLRAVEYVGMLRLPDAGRMLAEIYESTSETAIKRAVLRGFSRAADRGRLLVAARKEASDELRLEAVRQLGTLKAGAELADLYAAERAVEVKKQILRGLAMSGVTERLMHVAQSEADEELRRTAIRSLGLNREAGTAELLTGLYAKDSRRQVRDAVIDALYTQGNATALVTLARAEQDPDLKRAIVRRLSTMRAKEATDYMVELLK